MTFPDDTFPDLLSSDLQSAYPPAHNAVKDAVETIEQRMVYSVAKVELDVATDFDAEADFGGNPAKRSTAVVYAIAADETVIAVSVRHAAGFEARLSDEDLSQTVASMQTISASGLVRTSSGSGTYEGPADLYAFLVDQGSGYPVSGTVTVKLWIGRA